MEFMFPNGYEYSTMHVIQIFKGVTIDHTVQ